MKEQMYFQKLLVLSREFAELDLKDFLGMLNSDSDLSKQQSDSLCFKIS